MKQPYKKRVAPLCKSFLCELLYNKIFGFAREKSFILGKIALLAFMGYNKEIWIFRMKEE